MSHPRILICGELVWAQKDAQKLLGSIAEVLYLNCSSRSEFLEALQPGGKYHGIVALYRTNSSSSSIGVFDEPLVSALAITGLKWVAHNGAGYDQIDVLACKSHGITVSNTPTAVDDATATTALYLLISALRNFSIAERVCREGKFKTGVPVGHDPNHKTLAILGLGGIGLRFAEMAHALPMRVVYHSRKKRDDVPDWCEYFGEDRLDEMLSITDVLSVHVPLREDTVGFVGAEMISKLKKGASIVNTARGKVIDEESMIKALESGHLSSAGLDVFPNEPSINPRLMEFPNVTLLPHMGTETIETQHIMEVRALTNVKDFLIDGKGKDIVPEMR